MGLLRSRPPPGPPGDGVRRRGGRQGAHHAVLPRWGRGRPLAAGLSGSPAAPPVRRRNRGADPVLPLCRVHPSPPGPGVLPPPPERGVPHRGVGGRDLPGGGDPGLVRRVRHGRMDSRRGLGLPARGGDHPHPGGGPRRVRREPWGGAELAGCPGGSPCPGGEPRRRAQRVPEHPAGLLPLPGGVPDPPPELPAQGGGPHTPGHGSAPGAAAGHGAHLRWRRSRVRGAARPLLRPGASPGAGSGRRGRRWQSRG